MVSYVLKSKEETQFQEVIPDEPRGRSGCPHFYAVTKSGFLNKKISKNILFQSEKEWYLKNPGLDCIVFLDNCSDHRSDDLVLKISMLTLCWAWQRRMCGCISFHPTRQHGYNHLMTSHSACSRWKIGRASC